MTLPRSGAAEWADSQATPDVTVNAALRALDAGLCQWVVVDRDLTAPPGSCADGANYLVATSGSGAWVGQTGKLATAKGTNASNGWHFTTVAAEGNRLYLQDENIWIQHNGSAWVNGAVGTPCEIQVAASDETTALTTGTAKMTFRMPFAMTLTAVRASVTTAPTGSTLIVDINESASTILSTKLSIDASERTSTTAASAAVISDAALADDAEITIDIDQVGATIAGAGLKVTFIGVRA